MGKTLPKLHSALRSRQFWGLLAALTALFLMGGSSRVDVQSLAILNPVMVLCCGVALLTLRREHWEDKKWVLGGFSFLFLLTACYLVPLPLAATQVLPGAESVAAIRAAANVENASPVLAIMPSAAWQSLFVLFAPLAIFLFAMQLGHDDLLLTLPMMIFAGTISGLVGLLQAVGSADSPLYLYRITNYGSAVGLFANRNHAAVFLACLFPMLAVSAARAQASGKGRKNTQRLIATAVAILIVPLILVTGSRSALLTGLIGLIGGLTLYGAKISDQGRSKPMRSLAPIIVAAVLLGLVFATIYFSRAEAIDRIFADPRTANVRAEFWASSLDLFWKYFPLGFGPGSFVQAFQNDEPSALLNGTYLNRLHNDWLETGLTFGLFGVLLLLCSAAYYVRRSFLLWFRMDGGRSAVALGRMASVIIAMLAIASLSDYPLRTPAMMGFAALTLLWFVHARREPKVGDSPA